MWRDGHNYHHKHFGNLDKVDLSQTILFTKKDYESWPTYKKLWVRVTREPVIFFSLTVQYIWIAGVLYTCIRKYGLFSLAVFERIASYAVYYPLYLMGLPVLPFYLSVHAAQGLGSVLFHLQHACNAPYRQRAGKWDSARAALEGSTFLQIPQSLKVFTNGIEYHHIHHLNTNVASYAMQSCHEALDGSKGLNWKFFGINSVDMELSFWSLFNVMLDEENNKMIPFSYSHL
jgi:acyl-lipid omega-6 desaturase (Delta-12 desaturase)